MSRPEYRSAPCVIGLHADCADAEPYDSGVPGVHHLACACTCHPAPLPHPEPPRKDEGGWYRLCWTVRHHDPLVPRVAYGVLVGRDVPALLRGMRGCLSPLAYHDPARVRAAAGAPGGWRYETAAVTVHAHRLAGRAEDAPPLACPLRKEGRE
ncbi:hypothetical protein [Streptomyces glaucosporus]|uniref:hypothetical protein n=1 Tax=Streptomyces glaucosporus TaxID=284044 RepID=UPI0031D24119